MKSHRGIALTLFAATLAACSSGGGYGGSPMQPVYPVMTITNSWTDSTDANHRFLLNANPSTDDGKTSGNFDGEEDLPDGSTIFQLSGTWTQGTVQFTVQRSPAVQYHGTFTTNNPTRLELDSTAGHLTLIHG